MAAAFPGAGTTTKYWKDCAKERLVVLSGCHCTICREICNGGDEARFAENSETGKVQLTNFSSCNNKSEVRDYLRFRRFWRALSISYFRIL